MWDMSISTFMASDNRQILVKLNCLFFSEGSRDDQSTVLRQHYRIYSSLSELLVMIVFVITKKVGILIGLLKAS